MNSKSLGRGLDALFQNEASERNKKNDLLHVPVASLVSNPGQPRQRFDPNALRELAASIKTQGVIQPLLVRPINESKWEIIAGERRWRAAKEAGLQEVPVYIRDLSAEEIMIASLAENLQREDLNPIEEAQAFEKLLELLHITQEEMADRLGKSRPTIANSLRLLKLSSEAKENLRDGIISAGHARCLLSINDPTAAAALLQQMRTANMTVREAEEAVATWKIKGKFPWNEEGQLTMHTPRQRKRKKPEELRRLQTSLKTSLFCKVTISGDKDNGRIILCYESREALVSLIERLGIAFDGHAL